MPVVDMAYQGFGQGLDEDAYGLRLMADTVEQIADVAGALELTLPTEAIERLNRVSYGMRAVLDGAPTDVEEDD